MGPLAITSMTRQVGTFSGAREPHYSILSLLGSPWTLPRLDFLFVVPRGVTVGVALGGTLAGPYFLPSETPSIAASEDAPAGSSPTPTLGSGNFH